MLPEMTSNEGKSSRDLVNFSDVRPILSQQREHARGRCGGAGQLTPLSSDTNLTASAGERGKKTIKSNGTRKCARVIQFQRPGRSRRRCVGAGRMTPLSSDPSSNSPGGRFVAAGGAGGTLEGSKTARTLKPLASLSCSEFVEQIASPNKSPKISTPK